MERVIKTKDKRKYMREYMKRRYHADQEFRLRIIRDNALNQKKKRIKTAQKNDYTQHLNIGNNS